MLFEMMNQKFKARGRKYQLLPNFGICCRELGRLRRKELEGMHPFLLFVCFQESFQT